MNIIILDDYQDAVRKLKCASKLEHLNAKVFTNTVKGVGQLSVRLRDAEVLVLIRERTHFPKQLLEKLPKLKLIAQTGKVGSHIDVEAATRLGVAVAEGGGSPIATAELTWALIMASMRRLPQYIAQPEARRLAAVRPACGFDAAELRPRHAAAGQDARHLRLRPHRRGRRRLRQGLRHARHRMGRRIVARARACCRPCRCAEQGSLLRSLRRVEPAPAPRAGRRAAP